MAMANENGGGTQVKHEAERIAAEMQHRLEGMRGYADDAGAWIKEFAREKPLAAIAVAVGVGFLFGRLLSRT
jgi:ElaB/YqjD/DUF883 family membrane-anchored ribosome-binding protein